MKKILFPLMALMIAFSIGCGGESSAKNGTSPEMAAFQIAQVEVLFAVFDATFSNTPSSAAAKPESPTLFRSLSRMSAARDSGTATISYSNTENTLSVTGPGRWVYIDAAGTYSFTDSTLTVTFSNFTDTAENDDGTEDLLTLSGSVTITAEMDSSGNESGSETGTLILSIGGQEYTIEFNLSIIDNYKTMTETTTGSGTVNGIVIPVSESNSLN